MTTTTPTQATPPPGTGPAPPAPLAAVLVLTFVASLGTGGVTNGISFLTESALGWRPAANFALAIGMGLVYVVSAGTSGWVLTRVRARAGCSSRGVLAGVLIGIGLAALLPAGWAAVSGAPGSWTVWAFALVFSGATGLLWPIVESYMSGGRRGRTLRGAIGRFNITWALAVAAAFWLMGPLVRERPLSVIAGLGLLHALAACLVPLLPSEPAPHPPDVPLEEDEEAGDAARALLGVCRTMLVLSYLLLSVLGPLLPPATTALGVPDGWRAPLASVWMMVRVPAFVVLEHWHGWHGSWWLPIGSGACMVGGFVAAVLARGVGAWLGADAGTAVFVCGLGAFGVGVAGVYKGALYYAMATHSAGVDAGGRHEALIGLGYTAGPAASLAAMLVVGPARADAAVLVATGVVGSMLLVTAARCGLRGSDRQVRNIPGAG